MMTDAQASADDNTLHRIVHDLDANLFVEAGAGTGKTYALVSRMVALVKAGVKMENIVAITFTEAAAAELSERIRTRMEQLLDDGHPDNANDLLHDGLDDVERIRIGDAIANLDQASIQTIHSFAARLLHERPLDVALPPGWTPWDDLAESEHFRERWDSWLEWILGDGDDVPAELRQVMRHFLSSGLFLGHCLTLAHAFHANYSQLRGADSLPAVDLPEIVQEALASLQSLAAECADPADRLREQLDAAIATVASVAEVAGDPVGAAEALAVGAKVDYSGNVGSRGNWNRPTTEIRSEFRTVGQLLQQQIQAAALYPLLRSLRLRFAVDYAADRKADGVATFDDLLVWARDLLLNGAVRRYFQSRYTHVLIDEFQDTDPLQAEIGFYLAAAAEADVGRQSWHTLLLRPGGLFIVGDAKQSIYRFRRADLGVTQTVKDSGQLEPLTLSRNRRSQAPILQWVNAVFGNLMVEDAGVQAQYAPLQYHADIQQNGLSAGVRVFGGATDASADDVRRIQARHVAQLAASYAGGGQGRLSVYDKDAKHIRAARLGDVCILIRSRTGLGILERALEEAGIPYRLEGGSLLFETQEVHDLLNCLRAIDDPSDGVSVAAALRSPAFACSDVDLLNWREAGGAWDYTAAARYDLTNPVGAAMDTLRGYHLARHDTPVSRLISDFVRERRLEELDLAEYRPREIWRRRQFLVEQARSLEAVHTARSGQSPWSLRQFILWADLQLEESTRITELAVSETDDDAVRIMTMHAAKGLEFPIVVLLGLDSAGSSRHPAVLFDTEANVAEISIGSGNARVQTPGYQALADVADAHGAAEEIRLAYVAATRARDHLLVSLYHKPDSKGSPPNEIIAAILGMNDGPLQSAVAMDAVGVVAMTAPSDAAPPALLDYDPEGWQAQRDGVIRSRSLPQAITATRLAQQAGKAVDGASDGESAIDDKDAETDSERPWRVGRGGTAFGAALHGTLQDAVGAVLPKPDTASTEALLARIDHAIDRVAGRHAADAGVATGEIIRLAKRAVQNSAVIAALEAPNLWLEIPVAAPLDTPAGPVVIEGIIDLLYLDHDGQMVILDYKSDRVDTDAAVQDKMDYYRWQGAAYAAAVESATGKTVKDVEFLFVRRDEACSISGLREVIAELPQTVVAGLPRSQ